jgi:hypothetical protein
MRKCSLNYDEAISAPDAAQWKQAMNEEFASLHGSSAWELHQLPAGRRAIDCRWVYAIKIDEKGSVTRYKAPLAAKGYSQQIGIDYNEVWAPVSQVKAFRAFLAVAAFKHFEVHQLDVKTAFLNGDIEEELYLKQPPGYKDHRGDL